jgi:hypothetical protein
VSDAVSVCNEALQDIGAQATVSSISPSDGSTEGDACSILYTPTLEMLTRAAHWNWARRQATLTLLKAAAGTPENATGTPPFPPQPWAYEYAYPSDAIKARFLLPQLPNQVIVPPPTTAPQTVLTRHVRPGSIPFQVGIDLDQSGNQIKVILTNLPQAQLIYTMLVTLVDLWDPLFRRAMVAALGARLVNALSRNRELFADQAKIAQEIVMQARVSDGNESVTVDDHLPDWVQARGLGDFSDGGVATFMGWERFCWPNGSSF